jgi:hypothetical protein
MPSPCSSERDSIKRCGANRTARSAHAGAWYARPQSGFQLPASSFMPPAHGNCQIWHCTLVECGDGSARHAAAHHSGDTTGRDYEAGCSQHSHRQVADAHIQVQRRWVRSRQRRLCFLHPIRAQHISASGLQRSWRCLAHLPPALKWRPAKCPQHNTAAPCRWTCRAPPAKTGRMMMMPLAPAMQTRQQPQARLLCRGRRHRLPWSCALSDCSGALHAQCAQGERQAARWLRAATDRPLEGFRRWLQTVEAGSAGAAAAAVPLEQEACAHWLQGGRAVAHAL